MSEITIKIIDNNQNGRIQIESNPTFRELINKWKSGSDLTNSEESALFVMNKLLERSKKAETGIITDRLQNVRDIIKR